MLTDAQIGLVHVMHQAHRGRTVCFAHVAAITCVWNGL
jgi:hypothetical protein